MHCSLNNYFPVAYVRVHRQNYIQIMEVDMYLAFLLALSLGDAFAKQDGKKDDEKKEETKSEEVKKVASKKTLAKTSGSKTSASTSHPVQKSSTQVDLKANPQRSNDKVSVYGTVGQEQQPNAHQPLGNREPQKPEYHKAPSNIPQQQVGKEDLPTASTLERPDKPQVGKPTVSKPPVSKPQVSKPHVDRPTNSEPQISKPHVDRPSVSKPQVSKPQVSKPTENQPQVSKPRVDRPTNSQPTTTKAQVEKNPTPSKQPVEGPKGDAPVKKPTKNAVPTKAPSLNDYENQPTKWTSGFNTGLSGPKRSNNSDSSFQKIDHQGKTSLSISSLSYASGYNTGMNYQDGGLGIALGIRPFTHVGAEVSYGQYTDALLSTDPERVNRPLQVVGQGFLLPEEFLSPFVSAGYVQNSIYLNDAYTWQGNDELAKQQTLLTGGVLGAGIEMNFSSRFSLEFDARYFLYSNATDAKPARNDATLTSVGMNFYF